MKTLEAGTHRLHVVLSALPAGSLLRNGGATSLPDPLRRSGTIIVGELRRRRQLAVMSSASVTHDESRAQQVGERHDVNAIVLGWHLVAHDVHEVGHGNPQHGRGKAPPTVLGWPRSFDREEGLSLAVVLVDHGK